MDFNTVQSRGGDCNWEKKKFVFCVKGSKIGTTKEKWKEGFGGGSGRMRFHLKELLNGRKAWSLKSG